jgi:hypothetical protein
VKATRVRVRRIDLFERPVTLRLPFRFGAATVTRCAQAFVRIEAEVDGRRSIGATAELMVPKWFDKSPALTHEQNAEQLRAALRVARDAYLGEGSELSPWALHETQSGPAIDSCVARGLPRLAAQFGPAQLDKAVADAALRAVELDWCAGLRAGVLGDPFSAKLPVERASRVALRHTVGLADRITDDEPGPAPDDGLPATLQQAVRSQGLTHFKLKLSGAGAADLDRLARIAAVLDAQAGDYRATLDGNETFASAEAVAALWRAIEAAPGLARLRQRVLWIEQPLPRAIALTQRIDAGGLAVPVIVDESDDHEAAFETAIELGYRGISSKACKGIYRSMHNALRVAGSGGALILSGEDLTCQAGLAVQQDTLLAASLGITHVERNGHHFVDGFGIASAAEAQAFAAAHAGFYRVEGGRPRLHVAAGRLDLATLHVPGFASAAMPRWDELIPIH